MGTRRFVQHCLLSCFLFAICIGVSLAQTPSSQPSQSKEQIQNQAPDIAGNWTGTWGVFNPAQGTTPPKDICKNLTAQVENKDGVWGAVFEGDCGRPYK